MNLNHALITTPSTGECQIDIEKAVKYFTPKCFISRWGEYWRLVRIRNKKAIALKVTISGGDAQELIKRLGLVAIKSGTFNSATTYRMETT